MKAISVRPPWSDLLFLPQDIRYHVTPGGILDPVVKSIETRTWQTPHRGDILICTAMKMYQGFDNPEAMEKLHALAAHQGKPEYSPNYGMAIGVAELYNITPMTGDHTADACIEVYPKAYAWMMRNMRLIKPFPVKGHLMVFDVELPEPLTFI